MDYVLGLPTELIIWIFESLGDIDDALHFARCCKYLHCIFDPVSVRLQIFKFIIERAPHHEHELSRRINLVLFPRILRLVPYTTECSASQDIVCRWQGMRFLYDLYCDSAVNEVYSGSTFPYITKAHMPDTTEAMASECPLSLPSGSICAGFKMLSEIERQKSYQRFYKAVTRHWNSVEMLWLVRTQSFQNAKAFDKAFERTWRMWTHNPTRCASEKMDIIEVVDFVWGFLARKPFHVSSLPDWLEGLGEDVIDSYIHENETQTGNWGYFVTSVFQYLRPPHIIELLLWMWDPSRWNFNQPHFLESLGLTDTWEGIQDDNSEMSLVENWVPINIVEDDIESSFTHMSDVTTVASQWEEYRYNQWSLDARARVFFRGLTEERIFILITRNELPG